MSNDLRIALLGPLIVTRGGQPFPDSSWRSRQERRLLGVLISARGIRVTTERLIDWLWPDALPDTAAVTLRSAISSLRHTLEPHGGARAPSHYILTRPGGYAWNAESDAQIDFEEFLRCQQVFDARQHGDAARAEAALVRMVALYRGDYLADEPDAPWVTELRDSLRGRFLMALQRLAEWRSAAGDQHAAIEFARRGLLVDRLCEPLYRVLMGAQARAGDVAGALQSYERYRRMLDDELGATPSAQTQMLHMAILRGDAFAMGGAVVAEGVPVFGRFPLAVQGTQGGRHAPTPFVGRAHELAALRGWIDDLLQRRGGVVTIVGEAGIGKTRLAEEALRLAEAQGARLIVLRCNRLERGLPFAPLSEALRPLLRAAPEAILRRLPPGALAQVADLLPLLHERVPGLPALSTAPLAERRNRLLDGLVDVAIAVARDAPLVVFCDDGQWADEATLAVLGRLARHASRRALLLMVAYRSEELAENAALHELLRMLGRGLLLRPVVLARFDIDEVMQFLAGLAQVQPGQLVHIAPRFAASSGGNPLLLGVAVQSLLEAHGAPSLAALLPDLEAGMLPPDLAGAPQVRELVLARLERLPAPARALLEQLAVIGRPVSLDVLEQLAGAAALESAQELLERQLLLEHADGSLAFGHDLVRSIVATTISSPRRRLLHRHAAEAIAALHGDIPAHAAELAFHFGQAGHGAEGAALHYAVVAGDQARRAYGYHEAVGHYDAALRVADRLGGRAPMLEVRRAFAGRLRSFEALLDWGGIMATSDRFDRWSAAYQPEAAPIVTLRRLALLRALMGDLAGAATISAEQARRSPDAPPAIHDMLRRMARILQPIDRADRGVPEEPWVVFLAVPSPPGTPAVELPSLLGPDEAALTLFMIGWAALMQGLLDDAEPCLQRAYVLACETGQASVAVIAALQLAHFGTLAGDAAATTHWLRLSLDLAQQAPEATWASIWPRIHEAFLLLLDDQFAAAQVCFEAISAQLHELPTFQSHRASVEVGLGLCALAAGDVERAGRRLEGALASPQLLYGFVYVAAQHGVARIAALRGDMAAARAMLAHACDDSARRGLLPEYVRTAIEVVRVERDFGDPAPALAQLREAAGLAEAAGLRPLAMVAASLLARVGS